MNANHLRYSSPQLDEGLSVVVIDGAVAGEVRTWNAGGQRAELVELHVELDALENARTVQLRWEACLRPTAAQAGMVRVQQLFAGELGPTRWFHLSLSRPEVPDANQLAHIGPGQTWALHLDDGRGPRQVGYLFRERCGTAWVDHYLMDATYRSPNVPGAFLELRRIDAGPTDGEAFTRLTRQHQVQAAYYRTPCAWHPGHARAATRVAC